MELINLNEAKKLSISELNNLKEFSENMIRIYEKNEEWIDVYNWNVKLNTINKIIDGKIKFVNN